MQRHSQLGNAVVKGFLASAVGLCRGHGSAGMLRLALEQVKASPVRFQIGDCRRTSLPAETFDTAFMSLVIHFTDPEKHWRRCGAS